MTLSKIITTHLTLNSPIAAVWHTLITLADYPRWNPVITTAAGTLAAGERLDLTVQLPDGPPTTFKPWVTAVEPHRYVEWLGRRGMPGIFDGRHSFTLTPLAGQRTLLQQSQTFTGALVPFSAAALTRTRDGFGVMNEALARQAARWATPRTGDPRGPSPDLAEQGRRTRVDSPVGVRT